MVYLGEVLIHQALRTHTRNYNLHLSNTEPVVTEPRLPEGGWVKIHPAGTELMRKPTSLPPLSSTKLSIFLPFR